MNPTTSFIIPTLNSAKVLTSCLDSIIAQDYPKKDIEILIIDGGSTDSTLTIAQKYGCKIIPNSLRTAEAAKAVGLKSAAHELIALVDSDNILPDSQWLKTMITPLVADVSIIGSEPISFTYRPNAGFIERYSALLGANDPYAYFTGQYDRLSVLSGRWTGLTLDTIDTPQYLKITLKRHHSIPTIGANGTIFRRQFLLSHLSSDYLFDIDIIAQCLESTQKPIYFAKVKTGIIHTFCESSISKFARKQSRRLSDFFYFQPIRNFPWSTSPMGSKNILFGLYSLSLVLPLIDTIRGFRRQPDVAWFFHPLACLISLYIYATTTIRHLLKLNTFYNRQSWQQ